MRSLCFDQYHAIVVDKRLCDERRISCAQQECYLQNPLMMTCHERAEYATFRCQAHRDIPLGLCRLLTRMLPLQRQGENSLPNSPCSSSCSPSRHIRHVRSSDSSRSLGVSVLKAWLGNAFGSDRHGPVSRIGVPSLEPSLLGVPDLLPRGNW